MFSVPRSDSLRSGADEINNFDNNQTLAKVNARSPSKARSLSDGSPPVLSPSPKFREPERRSKDDASIESPSTPRRPTVQLRGLSLQMPRDLTSAEAQLRRMPLSPKLDHSSIYGSPASSIPRRSRGLDFSRAATNLHHSTLAEQSSPDSSPTITGRAMNIPNRRSGHFGFSESPSGNPASLWSTLVGPDRSMISSSLGSVNMLGSDSSGSSSDDDLMDADEIDDSMLSTPMINKTLGTFESGSTASPGSNWMTANSPAMSSLMNFQRARMRHRNGRHGSSSGSSMASPRSRSPPSLRSIDSMSSAQYNRDISSSVSHARRESISWAANQLHISGSESDDGTLKSTLENTDGMPITPGRDGQRGVIRRVVTRRGNLLPKTKGFARIRAALAEESAPIETEIRREGDVVRQVRESDMTLEPTRHTSVTAHSSPIIGATQAELEDIPEDRLIADSPSNPSIDKGLSSSFKQQALLNFKDSKGYWESFLNERAHTPPPLGFLPRRQSSAVSEDMALDSPLFNSTQVSSGSGFTFPMDQTESGNGLATSQSAAVPTAVDMTRKLNNKRRRDDDLDPTSFKRRAVSPGMSVHNSPVMQSPLQRDSNPWGTRQSSVSGSGSEKAGTGPLNAPVSDNSAQGRNHGTKRIGFQGMVDTNDSLMKMSIE